VAEVAGIGVPDTVSDLLHSEIVFAKHLSGFFHSHSKEISMKTLAAFAAEELSKV
jgi:hypothetical protein